MQPTVCGQVSEALQSATDRIEELELELVKAEAQSASSEEQISFYQVKISELELKVKTADAHTVANKINNSATQGLQQKISDAEARAAKCEQENVINISTIHALTTKVALSDQLNTIHTAKIRELENKISVAEQQTAQGKVSTWPLLPLLLTLGCWVCSGLCSVYCSESAHQRKGTNSCLLN